MRTLLALILFLPNLAFAKAPECPLYANKEDCLQSVEENYNDLLDFIKQDYLEDQEEPLLLAASDTKYYETLACEKTCSH